MHIPCINNSPILICLFLAAGPSGINPAIIIRLSSVSFLLTEICEYKTKIHSLLIKWINDWNICVHYKMWLYYLMIQDYLHKNSMRYFSYLYWGGKKSILKIFNRVSNMRTKVGESDFKYLIIRLEKYVGFLSSICS